MTKITHFKKDWLKGVKLIQKPMGKVELQVASTVSEKNRIDATEPGKSDKYIVTLKAIPVDQLTRISELFKNTDEVPIEEMKGVFLTASIWVNDPINPPTLPLKGEKAFCSIDHVQTRKTRLDPTLTPEYLLRVTNIALQPAEVAVELDLDAFDSLPVAETADAAMEHADDLRHS